MNQKRITWREVDETDCQILFDWRNDPDVYKYQRNTKPLLWHSHVCWFESRLKTKLTLPFLAYQFGSELVGYARIDEEGKGLFISIIISSSWRKKGIGQQVLSHFIKYMENKFEATTFFAYIHKDNIASSIIFMRTGFRKTSHEESNFILFCLDR